jgi:hypothetical protein
VPSRLEIAKAILKKTKKMLKSSAIGDFQKPEFDKNLRKFARFLNKL